MVRPYIRQTLAVLVAATVVLSFVGAPVAAAALDTESESGLGSLGDDTAASDDTADDSDGSDVGSTGDEQTDDDTDDRSITNDTSDGRSVSDDRNESDDDSTDRDDAASDDASLGGGNDATNDDAADEDSDDSSGDGSLSGDDGDDSTASESDQRTMERVTDVVNGTTNVVENTTAGIEESTDSLEDDGVVRNADGLLASVSNAALDLTSLEFDTSFDSEDVAEVDRSYDDAARDHDEPPTDDGTSADDDEGADDDDATAAADTGDGSGPDPADPAGAGAAIGLGAVATAAALRGSPVVAGSKAATSGGVLSMLLDKVRPFLFPLRYSRYDDSDPLEHEARERVYEIVDETPGSYLSAVSQEADLPLSTTRHHIKVLEREGLVTSAKLHGKRRFYPAYAEGIELAAALNDESTAKIIDAIARIGAATVSDLADELGRDPSTISHHLQRLEDDGVIIRERDGRAVVNRLSAEARTALEPDAPAPDESGEVVAGGAD